MSAKIIAMLGSRWGRGFLLVAICGALSGCGGKEAPASKPAPAKSSGAAAKTTAMNEASAVTAMPARPEKFLSIFSTNDVRDPFHPKLKPKAAATANVPENPQTLAEELQKALAAGFKGIYGTADEKMALVYDVLLVPQREFVINVPLSSGVRRFKVKATKILRTSVEMQVEGIPQPIIITPHR
jgi:hypothetical protein